MSDSFQNIEVTSFPDITKIEFKKINRTYFKVILVNFLLLAVAFFSILTLLHQLDFLKEFNEYMIFIYAFFFVFLVCFFFYLRFSFPKRKYAVRERDISYKTGLFVKKTTTVPFSRIQHIEIDEKPISRIFGLASLSVYTAGDSSDDLVVRGLKKEVSIQLKEFISTKIDA